MKDGLIKSTEPGGLVAYTSVPYREWFNDFPYTMSTMNLFRTEEHVRNWSGFKMGTEEGILELSVLHKIFSGSFFSRRLDPDYCSHRLEYRGPYRAALAEIGKTRPFWSPPGP